VVALPSIRNKTSRPGNSVTQELDDADNPNIANCALLTNCDSLFAPQRGIMINKRALWTIGVGFAGLVMGEFNGGDKGAALGLLWGVSVGYGFGSIFDEKLPIKQRVYYWMATLAIASVPFGLVIGAGLRPSVSQDVVHGLVGFLVGAVLGLVVGSIGLRRSRRA
jgi:hypothetical protein